MATVLFALCTAVVALLYLSGLTGGYYFDDLHVLEQNPYLKVTDFYGLIQASSSFAPGGRGLSMLSFALNHWLFGDSTWWYKLVNVVIHCINGLLLFVLFDRLLCNREDGFSGIRRSFKYVPLATAVLWLAHPINLTSVLYISQRMAQLSTLFILLGLISYVWARNANLPILRQKIYPPIILLSFSTLGFMAKENAVLLPVFAFIIELTILKFRRAGQYDRWIILMYITGALVLTLFLAGKFWLDPQWLTEGYRSRFFSFEERIMTQFRALGFYLVNIIFPSNAELGLWHDDIQVSTGLLTPPSTLVSLVILVVMFATAIYSITKIPLLALGILWFFVGHSMESTLLPLELVHEHRNYMASFGILLALVGVMQYVVVGRERLFLGACTALFVLFSTVLAQRAVIWGDDFRHVKHNVTYHPTSGIANYEMARHYYQEILAGENEGIDEALHYGMLASEYDQHSILPEMFLVLLSENPQLAFDQEWLIRAGKKLKKYPYIAASRQSLRAYVNCLAQSYCHVPPEYIRPLVDVAEATGHSHLMTTVAGFYLHVEKDPERAEQSYRKAWRKRSSSSWINYINILVDNQKFDEACQLYREFRTRYKNREFRNISLYIDHLAKIEHALSSCLRTS